jgi:RecA-family ATPase
MSPAKTGWARCREKGPAFYIGAEDDTTELHIRLAAITKHCGVTFAELISGGLHVLPLLGQDATLCYAGKNDKVETTDLYKQLYQAAGDIKPKSISIDTLSRAFAGAENDRVQVYGFASHMQALAMVAGGSVTILCHASLSGINSGSGISGSTAWHGAFRFRQCLTGIKPEAGEQPNTDLRQLEFRQKSIRTTRRNHRPEIPERSVLPLPGVTSLDKLSQEVRADDAFLDLLRRFTRENRNIGDKPGTSYAPAKFAKEEEAKKAGLNGKQFEAAMRRRSLSARFGTNPMAEHRDSPTGLLSSRDGTPYIGWAPVPVHRPYRRCTVVTGGRCTPVAGRCTGRCTLSKDCRND